MTKERRKRRSLSRRSKCQKISASWARSTPSSFKYQ